MANREKGGRVVFIGNIPYGVSEEQICELFARCGTVVSFRLVYDKETGRPKGFGFLEYTDVDAAAAAVRNLNDFELNGRTLRVDYSNDNDKGGKGGGGDAHDGGQSRAPPPAHFSMPPPPDALPPLPTGAPLPPGLTAPDAVSRTLQAIPADQLLDILSQFKALATNEPAKATQLLNQAPQLGYAIFQALLLMNLVSTEVLGQLIQTTTQAAAQAPAPPPQQMPPQMPPQYAAPPPQQLYPPPPQFAQPPSQQPPMMPPFMPPPPQQQFGYAPTPPQQQVAYAPPPPQQAAQPPAQDQSQLMQTIMALSREQIMGLDEASRNQVLLLRGQMGMPGF
ncbi:hypothetical protein LTR95_003986 [Oleoguttula sp. CCFEE 5521]